MHNMAIVSHNEIIDLPIDRIRPNPYQPRKFFERSTLMELSKSISQYGVMQPISVRFINEKNYEIVSGERRLRASRMAGLFTVPCIIVNVSDRDSAAIALVENIQRENINFIEEAEGYYNLIKDYGYTQEQLSEIVGKSRSAITNKLRILKLDYNTKKRIIENNLTESHARALLKAESIKLREEILDKVIKYGLNVKRTEEMIEEALKKRDDTKIEIIKSYGNGKKCFRDMRLFTNTIKQAVDIMKDAGIETEYVINNDGELYEINIKVDTSEKNKE